MKKLLGLILVFPMLLLLGIPSCVSAPEPEIADDSAIISTHEDRDQPDGAPAPKPDSEPAPARDPEPAFATVETAGIFAPRNDLSAINLPEPSTDYFPKWRGFNKLNLYDSDSVNEWYDHNGFPIWESDFALMHDLGFNFLRFPMDYRYFYNKENKEFDMSKIAWIDDAIEYGIKYNIHIELNLHRAPGYRVADWSVNFDTFVAESEHFIEIWTFLAKRYQNIPNAVLDFNLLNEPSADHFIDYTGFRLQPEYARILNETINAIRAYTPDRLIVLDADHRNPYDLSSLQVDSLDNIWQSQHGYAPFTVTHHGLDPSAEHPPGFENPQITWPIENYFNGFLYANWKSTRMFGAQNTKAVFNHPGGFGAGEVKVEVVSQSSWELDGVEQNTQILRIRAYDENGVQTATDTAAVPHGSGMHIVGFAENIAEGAKKIEIYLSGGDWAVINSYQLGDVIIKCTNADWGYPPSEMTAGENTVTGADTIRDWYIPEAWENVPVMFGEVGCMAQHENPYQTAYRARLMADYADAFMDHPWAYWEFKGGNMSMFRLGSSGAHTAEYTVNYGAGNTCTYWVDALWYNAIKHTLENPYNGF